MAHMKPIIKLVIAVLLLLILADMPYGFYLVLRFAAMAVFAYLSYDSFSAKRDVKVCDLYVAIVVHAHDASHGVVGAIAAQLPILATEQVVAQ